MKDESEMEWARIVSIPSLIAEAADEEDMDIVEADDGLFGVEN